jgi:hypothetical protein
LPNLTRARREKLQLIQAGKEKVTEMAKQRLKSINQLRDKPQRKLKIVKTNNNNLNFTEKLPAVLKETSIMASE